MIRSRIACVILSSVGSRAFGMRAVSASRGPANLRAVSPPEAPGYGRAPTATGRVLSGREGIFHVVVVDRLALRGGGFFLFLRRGRCCGVTRARVGLQR